MQLKVTTSTKDVYSTPTEQTAGKSLIVLASLPLFHIDARVSRSSQLTYIAVAAPFQTFGYFFLFLLLFENSNLDVRVR